MILNKKGFMVLPLAALLFATSCAKQISYKEAVDFVKANYTSTEPKALTKAHVKFSANAKDDTTKLFIKSMVATFGLELDDNLKCDKDIDLQDGSQPLPPITTDMLINPEEYPDLGVKYSLKGKSLTMELNGSIKNEKFEIPDMMTIDIKDAKASGSVGTNDQGYLTNVQVKMDLDATITVQQQPVSLNFTDANLSLNLNY